MAKKLTFEKNYRDYMGDKLSLKTYQRIGVALLVVVIMGFVGWLHEFLFTFANEGFEKWYMKGGNFLPWMNIYAIGSLAVVVLTYRFRKKPWLVFIAAFIITGLIELVGGWLVYTFGNGTRYWDYNNQPWNFGNIGGFVCLLSVSAFAVGSLFLIYGVLPFCVFLSRRMKKRSFLILVVTLFMLVMMDELTNLTLKNLNQPTAMDFYQSMGWEYR